MTRATSALAVLLACTIGLAGQVPGDRLRNAVSEPRNWLTYSGTHAGHRYSLLRQIDPANVKNLEMKWMLQNQVFGPWEASPLVVDGIMYLTQRPNDVLAIDAKDGRIFWVYKHPVASDFKVCCGANNRGLAILGDTLFMGTLDARLVAVDARSGRLLWNVKVAVPPFKSENGPFVGWPFSPALNASAVIGRNSAIAERRMATTEISTRKLVRWETCPLPVTLNGDPLSPNTAMYLRARLERSRSGTCRFGRLSVVH